MTEAEAKEALSLLANYIWCSSRSEAARLRASWHPGTYTAEKELDLSSRWDDKSEKALNQLKGIIQRYTGV
jgi:hypothetical protein